MVLLTSFEGVCGIYPMDEADVELPGYAEDDAPLQSGGGPTEEAPRSVASEQPYDDGVGTLGRRYPGDVYGNRSIPRSRRPPGAPPEFGNTCLRTTRGN